MRFLISGFQGKEKLWKVTWLGYLGLVVMVAILMLLVGAYVDQQYLRYFGPLVFIVNVWGLVAMWRCAPNVKWKGWMYIARALVVLTAVTWLLDVLGMLDP